jgi:methylmalonyl-CoA mutase N-terminal domain/subunit
VGLARYTRDDRDRLAEVEYQSGIKVKTLYGPEDLERVGFSYEKDLADPGNYPFTRGIHPEGYRSRAWTMRQYSGFGTAAETNERFKFLISHGSTGLNVAFDLPTQMGYDSDDPMSEGEVGRVGMAIDSLRDFEIAFEGIDLAKIGASLTANAVASIILAMYQAMAEKYGYSPDVISATPQNDILKEMIGRGAWIFPVEPAVNLIGDTIEHSIKAMPKTNPVSVSGYHIRESGATSAQEMAYAILIANAYIDNVLKRGYEVDHFVGRFSFNFNIFGNLWETVAKYRAGRKLWARNLKEKYGVKQPQNMFMRGMFGGGGGGLTKEEPENNIMRSAYYALAAALAGAQTTGLCSYDEAYTIPTPRAALLSLRTLQLLMEEVGLRDTVDPLAGSYFMETITKEMEQKIEEEMEKIEKVGGIIPAVSTGYAQRTVARQAYEFEKGIQSGNLLKVGVNIYTGEAPMEVELHEYNYASAEKQVESLHEVKQQRNSRECARTLSELEGAAKAGKNVMPYLVDCCKAYATVGEMTKVFRNIYGEFLEPSIF